eukprot:357303_1
MFKSIFSSLLVLLLVGKTTSTTTTRSPEDFSDISLDLSAYDYDDLFPTSKFCNQLSDSYERTTQDAECDGEWLNFGIGKVCYPECKSGYIDQIITGGAGCLEQCGGSWAQIDMICTKAKMCNSCIKICAPWPFHKECTNICTDYPCGVYTKTADHYWRDIQTDLCPIGFDNIIDAADTIMCLSKCGDGYEPGINVLQCLCDVTDTINHLTFATSFLNDIQDQMSVGLDILTEILSPALFGTGTSTNEIYDIFGNADDALAYMGPYLNDIGNFIMQISTSTRRRLASGWSGDDLVGALEISASIHLGAGVSAGIGFAFYNGGVKFYTFACSGFVTDIEMGISLGLTFYNNIESLAGSSFVFGAGADLPFAGGLSGDLYGVLTTLDSDTEFIGIGFSFGVGGGFMPIELNGHTCTSLSIDDL